MFVGASIQHIVGTEHNATNSIVVHFHNVGVIVRGLWFYLCVYTSRIIVQTDSGLTRVDNISRMFPCARLMLPAQFQTGCSESYIKCDADHYFLRIRVKTCLIHSFVKCFPRNYGIRRMLVEVICQSRPSPYCALQLRSNSGHLDFWWILDALYLSFRIYCCGLLEIVS